MKILVNENLEKLGVSSVDIKCMLKAVNKEVLSDEYAPSVNDIADLLSKAIDAESKKNRTVAKWSALASEFKSLLK